MFGESPAFIVDRNHHVSASMNTLTKRTEPSPNRTLQPVQPACSENISSVSPIGIARLVNDELRTLVNVGPAVDADQASAAVVVPLADDRDRRGRTGPGDDADPGLIGQDRVDFAGEDGLRQTIGDIPRARAGILIKRPVDHIHVDSRAKGDRFRNREIEGVSGRAIPRRVLPRVDAVMAMRKKIGGLNGAGLLGSWSVPAVYC